MKLRNRARKKLKKVGTKIAQVSKDVSTSATRIVTDMAIDLGDAATGFQFTDKMQRAKEKMSEAGVLSAADAIEKNHYSELKPMAAQAQSVLTMLERACAEGEALEAELERRSADLLAMLEQVALLSHMSNEARTMLAALGTLPAWRYPNVDVRAMDALLGTLDAAEAHWARAGTRLVVANAAAGIGSAATGVASWRALVRSKKLAEIAKLTKGTKAAKAARNASRFASLGKLMARSSGVLSVATVGLDIALSVTRLEAQKNQLEHELERLDQGLLDARRQLDDVRLALQNTQDDIALLLRSVQPPQTEATWSQWFASTEEHLQQLRNRLTSMQTARDKAQHLARRASERGYGAALLSYIASVAPGFSLDDAKQIVAELGKHVDSSSQVGGPR